MNHNYNFADVMEALAGGQYALNLAGTDLGFVCGVYTQQVQQEVELSEHRLLDIFYTIDKERGGLEETRQLRATNTIRKLLDQGVLRRLRNLGEDRSNYRLTRLGKAIAEGLFEEHLLTAQTLSDLFLSINNQLRQVLDVSLKDLSPSEWEEDVDQKLNYVVSSMIESLEYRNDGLDAEQKKTEDNFVRLYKQMDSKAGLDQCQSMLDSLAQRLSEMDKVVVNGAIKSLDTLNQIIERANATEKKMTSLRATKLYDKMISINQWVQKRSACWEQYYQNACEFIQQTAHLGSSKGALNRINSALRRFHAQETYIEVVNFEGYVAVSEELEIEKPSQVYFGEGSWKAQSKLELESTREKLKKKVHKMVDELLNKKGCASISDLVGLRDRAYENADLFVYLSAVVDAMIDLGKIRQPQDKTWLKVDPYIAFQNLEVVAKNFGDEN